MKKIVIKAVAIVIVFCVTMVIAGKIINQDNDNLTMEMLDATLPVVMMEWQGVEYNELHGYTVPMDAVFMRETVTVLGKTRNFTVHAYTYGANVTGMSIELRSIDGERLIENTDITDFEITEEQAVAEISLKDLITQDTEYTLRFTLVLNDDQEVYYYTRVVWSEDLHVDEKIDFVRNFHEKLYDREAARELTKYLETNSQLEDNTSFHKVNIHSSFKQITWGDLKVQELGAPSVLLTDIGKQTASFLIKYTVYSESGDDRTYYRVVEHYRVRYTSDRMYLLNYERTMTQIPDVNKIYAGNKILLGITDTKVDMEESEDGNSVVFVVDDQLYSYNTDSNKLTVIFGFYDSEHADARTMYDAHAIKILDINEGENVSFAVYGYMNRGRHEGEVGIQIYTYNSTTNTIEENIYIPYDKSYALLKPQVERLLYLNREQKMYLMLEDNIYSVDLEAKTYYPMATIAQSDTVQVSENNRILAWQEEEDAYHSRQLNVRNLNMETQQKITVGADEAIRPLGFMGEDVIYGVAREEDIYLENSGRIFFPMYKVCICDSEGNLLKEYQQKNIYVMDCSIESNQITLERVRRLANGSYEDVAADQIMNSIEAEQGKYVIVAPGIDIYERYVQIQTRREIDKKTLRILTPKEVVFEGGRDLVLDTESETEKYYVYGAYGVEGIFTAPAKAVALANQVSGQVIDRDGNMVWLKGNRSARNQIMAITEVQAGGGQSSLALCLDTMLKYEGITRNSEDLLNQGQTVMEVLEGNLDARILNLTGCDMDTMLYYVNQDIPVLALLDNGGAVLITGFNEYNVVIMNPASGTLAKMGMNDAADWFKQNGNNFVTYYARR